MGKGSSPRPFSVSLEEYNNNLDRIFGQKPKKEQYVPPPLPTEIEEEKKVDWGNVSDSQQGG